MNTRQPIQPSNTPLVLSLSSSTTRNRITAGLSSGVLVFRSDNCLPTYNSATSNTHPDSPFVDRIAVAEALDDRYIAFVPRGKGGAARAGGAGREVVFWDCLLEREVQRFDFVEEVKGIRVARLWMGVVLQDRTIVFSYQQLRQSKPPPKRVGKDEKGEEKKVNPEEEDEVLRAPNKVQGLHPTSGNPYALACLQNDLLVIPAKTTGQVQLVPLPSGSKRVLRAHNTALRCIGLSPHGNLVATASEQGTLIRVFSTKTLDQVAEFRRGVEKAIVYSLAFSDGERWLACTSDKGTVHVFDLRPPPPPVDTSASINDHSSAQRDSRAIQQHRKTSSHPLSHQHRPSAGAAAPSISESSGRSSPSTVIGSPNINSPHPPSIHGGGSVQEYYTLRPPPITPSSPPAVASAMTAFKQSSWAPKVLKDVRSVASHAFHTGDEGSHWQTPGGASHVWTTGPGGVRRRVKNTVMTLPADPSGRPVKGLVAFASAPAGGKDIENVIGNVIADADEEGAVLYVVGGGTDARWECFDLVPRETGGWALVRRGWRRILERQFVE